MIRILCLMALNVTGISIMGEILEYAVLPEHEITGEKIYAVMTLECNDLLFDDLYQ